MKSEYDWLLEFFIQIVSFEAVTSTFVSISKEERLDLISSIGAVKDKLDIILPKVQNREMYSSKNYGGTL